MKRTLLFLLLFIGLAGSAKANSVYLAQTAAGGNTGADCADALAVSYFNASGNWTAGTPTGTQIGQGTTVFLCGTITSQLTFQGSGASGNPVTLDGSNGTISTSSQGTNTGTSYSIGVASKSWFVIQNVAWVSNYTNSLFGIRFSGASNGIVNNMSLDQFLGGASDSDVIFFACPSGTSSGITIENSALGYSSGANAVQRDGVAAEGCATNITLQGDQFDNRTPDNGGHDDMIQVFAGNGGSNTHPGNWTIRYSRFTMNTVATQNKSCTELENIAGTWDFYGNIFEGIAGGSGANCLIMDGNDSSMVAHIYGNTFVQHSGGFNNIMNLSGPGSFNLVGNIIYNTNAGNALTGGASFTTRSNNLWFGANIPSCVATEVCANPLFNNFAGNDYTLQTGSPALGTGTNLGATYNLYPVPGATWPNPTTGTRPATGAWDIGAYQSSGGTPPGPPPVTLLSSLPSGIAGSSYSVQLASGGTPPFHSTSTFPAGLTFSASGVLGGTPPTAGTFPFNVTVTDSYSPPQSASASESLTITAAPPPPPPPPPSAYTLYSTPTSLSFTGNVGASIGCQSLTAHDTSPGGPIPLTILSNSSWLTVSPNTGGTPATISACPSTVGLSAGSFSGAIVLTETGPNAQGQTDGNSPFSIPVSLTLAVAPPPPPPSPIATSCSKNSNGSAITCKFTTTGIHGSVSGTVAGGGRTGTWSLTLP